MSESTVRPQPTSVYHFTHIRHLSTILQRGLVSDSEAQRAGLIQCEAGNQGIKAARRLRPVDCHPYGVVADYVPFYYSPRSPMLFAIHKGNVPTFTESCDNLLFLLTSTQRLRSLGLSVLGSDRNARMQVAEFSADDARISEMTSWDVMRLQYWHDAPDGGELRQAECLVHGHVPWDAIENIGTMNAEALEAVHTILDTVCPASRPPADVRPQWYF